MKIPTVDMGVATLTAVLVGVFLYVLLCNVFGVNFWLAALVQFIFGVTIIGAAYWQNIKDINS